MIDGGHDRASRTREARAQIFCALLAAALLAGAAPAANAQVPTACRNALDAADLVEHDFSASFCTLCDVGTVRIVVENPLQTQPGSIDLSQLVVREDLGTSGLTYVPGSTTFFPLSGAPPVVEPVVSGANGRILTWTIDPGFTLSERPSPIVSPEQLVIEFQVRRAGALDEEGLVSASRLIESTLELEPSCAPGERYTQRSGQGTLPLREPIVEIQKRGRNVDAGQLANRYNGRVYAHANDDVIWRIRVRNTGQADLQDFEFTDSITPGNFEIHSVCDSEADATAAAGGPRPGRCVPIANRTDVFDLDVARHFGNGADPFVVAGPGGQRSFYLIGRVTDSCTNRVNTVSDVAWGCQVDAPVGGILTSSTGVTPGDDATLRTQSRASTLDVDVALTGVNTSQPMGARGTVTITISNATRGTILGDASGITLHNLLPAEYVLDPTFAPTLTMRPAYGTAYPGMVDTLTWTNPAAPGQPLDNRDLRFELTSSTSHPDFPEQVNMIRHGDVVTVTVRTVLIDSQYYDRVGNLDVRLESPGSDPANTDPTERFPISDRAEIWFEEFCTGTEHHLVFDENDEADPEDLDVDLVGSELLFILTDTGDPLPLTVALTNNGGHDATDYQVYVTFGQAMEVQTVAAGCSLTSNPPQLPNWRLPADLPPTGSVYRCDRGTVSPGEWELLDFEVVKNTAPPFDDDLTFRADVLGEITLSDGSLLTFPAPIGRADGVTDRANDYSLDAVRSRVVGYNLFKSQLGACSENPPSSGPDDEIQIGEQCTFRVESGGWFGFETPGFTYIAVQNVQVVDQNPDGQGFLSATDPLATSTSAIRGVRLNPPPAPLADAFFDWTSNTLVPAERITEKDHWFRADFTTRLLNDPIDTVAPPNEHAAPSSNILTSTFDAIFHNPITNLEETYRLGPNTIGFPREVHRRVDVNVSEPRLTLVKEVCNETLYGAGAACSNFVTLADDGDAFDTYVYRVTVTNEAAAGGVNRSPAYDVTVTHVADPSDMLFLDPLTGDQLENDADGAVDGADANGEGSIGDNVVQNGTPAQLVASYTHSAGLLRIDPGQSVRLYYRVDPDDDVAPQQRLTNTVTASYDSLEGASGNQTDPIGANGETGGARRYAADAATATIQIIPVEVRPKQVRRTSLTPLVPSSQPQPVSIGEEVEFQIEALIPVAQLRQLVVRDELPVGVRCAEAPTVDLGAPPYDAAGFVPGGVFTPTCSEERVVWNFGDQTITRSPRDDRRFDFGLFFIARIDNAAANQDGLQIANGGVATVTTVAYVDEGGGPVVLPLDAATVVVREPQIALSQSFSVAQVDAGDLPRITVTATNVGTAPAYNVRVLDDLSAVDLAYAGDIAGPNAPAVDLAAFGVDRPLFHFVPDVPVAPGESLTFSYAVRVGDTVEPHQILANTLQADWTSLPGAATSLNTAGAIGPDGSVSGMRIGALPNAADVLNDYETTADASVVVPPPTLTKIDLDPALAPEIGAHKPYEAVITLPEGRTRGIVLTELLDGGDVSHTLADLGPFAILYAFEGIASINGQPPGPAALTARPADGARGQAVWSIGEVISTTEDDTAASAVTPRIRVRYFARIENDVETDAGDTLQSSARTDYRNGETDVVESMLAATPAIVATEPQLTATKTLENVTPGKTPASAPAFNDLLQYVVTVVNGGTAVAHDVNVVDVLPPALALDNGFLPTAAIDGLPVAGFLATPRDAPDGPLTWGAGNSDASLDIAPGGFLELTYRVRVRTPLPDPDVLANRVWVDWTSLDAVSGFERTGAGCPTVTAPNDYCFGPAVAEGTAEPVAAPTALQLTNTQPVAAVGEVFAYRITIPSTPYAFPLFDVQIHDDLTASAADLRFVGVAKVSGSMDWTPANTGTDQALTIEDATGGIDIPAGEQVVIELTVRLEDTPTNTSGLTFTNTASYLYDWIDDNPASQRPGLPGTSAPMTIVGPDALTLEKRGPVVVTIGVPATFTLDVQNTGDGAAHGLTLTDRLPSSPAGGMCASAPRAVTAQVFEADGTTAVSAPLVEGTDFATVFAGVPDCTWTATMSTPAAAVGAGQRLIATYQAELDATTQDAIALTNVAGATRWLSAAAPFGREYTRALTNGTVGVVDHEDALTTTSSLPQLRFENTAVNMTSGADPAVGAIPGDTLRYRIEVESLSAASVATFSLVDEIDAMNGAALFVPGSLQLVTVPPGSDASATRSTGGARGTGMLEIRNLSLPAVGDRALVEFDVTLAAVIPNAAVATNQAKLMIGGAVFATSDDPNVNGSADPLVAGDEDPTRVAIQSAPVFDVKKVSQDLTGDAALLRAGDTLRYTLTVQNVGSDDASDAMLRDAIPVNTRYVAGSTTLNGAALPDLPGGTSPLGVGIPLHTPSDPTPGRMAADAAANASLTATLTFDVVVAPDVPDGTLISNQAFVSAVLGGVVDQPSDDPATPTPNDPTRDVVGNLPLLFAAKDVAIQTDGGTAGVVDPGDVLRYTITVRNDGAIPATGATLRDAVPANTRWVANSLTLNGMPVGQPDGGASPLEAGIALVSNEPTPPPSGVLSPGGMAVVYFDLQVDAGVSAGTLISNQATVATTELPNLLTDGDGNPATGPEPTVVIVGDGQQLSITKSVSVVGGGAALPGAQLEYVVRVVNVATVPASNVVLTDDLAMPVAGELAYVANSASLNGVAAGVMVTGSVIRADYSATNGPLAPGAAVVLRFLATLDPSLPMGRSVVNTGVVSWNSPTQTAMASVSLDVGGMPGVGMLSGSLWHDADFDLAAGSGERALEGWRVELLRNGEVVHTVLSDPSGAYAIPGLAPNDANGDTVALRFVAPGAGARSAGLGYASSPYTNGMQAIDAIVVTSGSNLLGLDLPIQPNGVVYDAIQRIPAPGVSLSLRNASSGALLPASCFDDDAQQGQVALADGYYRFDLNFSNPACPSGASYALDAVGAGTGYRDGFSGIVSPATDLSTTPFSVPACLGGADDAISATALHCEVQDSPVLPPSSASSGTPRTRFHTHVVLAGSRPPGTSQLFNNHLAMDPAENSAVAITKTTPLTNVALGQLVPYEITIHNQTASELSDLSIVDRFPAGFRYVEGSARLDGDEEEPVVTGRELRWDAVDVPPSASRKLLLLLGLGAGVGEGEYTNRAQVIAPSGGVALSGEATATVRVVPAPEFACTDVMGKVFDDADRDGQQDRGEAGLEGVRLVTPKGLIATTDAHGRFHIMCAIVPHPERGSNMVVKLDDRSLPSGYRLSTREIQIKRATRGKALRFRFGASIHRVVGLDLTDAVFEPDTATMRSHWRQRIPRLLDELQAKPATLRLAYVADLEGRRLVERRLDAVEAEIDEAWQQVGADPLTIEREVYWRRGAPRDGMLGFLPDLRGFASSFASGLRGSSVVAATPGRATERILPMDAPLTSWTQTPTAADPAGSDRLEEREVLSEHSETVKLENVVPPVRFVSGETEIPPETIAALREQLAAMEHLDNVRLHFVGHADDQPLSPALADTYGDNEGISRERAGEVAELLQGVLDLPPESISFAWEGASAPLAPNATAAGRAQNRRVEVEIWYDEVGERVAVEEVVVPSEVKRVKVCRVETVCMMRLIEGHERRARVRNLIAPLRIGAENARVPADFVRQIEQALRDLDDERNVTVKFLGFTDDAALEGRAARIYGTHLALSKAMARRVSLAVRDELGLAADAVASDGRGAARPLASNETPHGRATNRRVEVEFWYDDPLQQLSDEPQQCPDAAEESIMTRVYDPPWGAIPTLAIEDGQPVVPQAYTALLERAMADVAHESNVRLRFVGYTRNEVLDRRTAQVYGDDIGLSAARAHRTMEQLRGELGLAELQAEHEGRGYVHANDVVNGGFVQGDTSHVAVQVVFDEPALLDDGEGVEITQLTRELSAQDPLTLNPMRVTVDGEPLDHPGRNSADIQRCTDVALDGADIQFRFDGGEATPRLMVTSDVAAVGALPVGEEPGRADAAAGVRFRMYTNYAHFIERAEVRVFERGQSLQSEPLAVVPIGADGTAEWQPAPERMAGPVRPLAFVLRGYDAKGRFDETAPQSLWMVEGRPSDRAPTAEAQGSDAAAATGSALPSDPLLAGYGETDLAIRNIDLDGVASVRVQGGGVPANHTVWLAGKPVPVDDQGRFIADTVVPKGTHTVEVAVLDEQGNGELFLRDLDLPRSDWFYTAIADVTFSGSDSKGAAKALQGENAPTDPDSFADGRLAFFVDGSFGDGWKLTASADTREGPFDEIFSNFLDKSPDALFRRMDPDYFYPTYGDDGTVEEATPSLGRFYAKLSQGDDHAMWGNFRVGYRDNELTLVERGLYGANVHFQTDDTTRFGERRLSIDGFAANPGTVPSREEFRGTGGSLYYLRHRDILQGSERLRIELRDKLTGLVSGTVPLDEDIDYDIDYIQGRVLLNEPIQSTVDDALLVRTGGLSGDEAWLVVHYEFAPGFDELDTLAAGGQASYWLNDFVQVGGMAYRTGEDSGDNGLYGATLTARKSTASWLKLQAGWSSGVATSAFRSDDGGFGFVDTTAPVEGAQGALGYRVDGSLRFADVMGDVPGRIHLYFQRLEAGYTAPGQVAATDTDLYGGRLDLPLSEALAFKLVADRVVAEHGLEHDAQEVDITYRLARSWEVSAGVRNDERKDHSPVQAATQRVGGRTDAVVQVGFDPVAAWNGYAFGQATVRKTGNRDENRRGGVGGSYQVSDRLLANGEVSYGDGGAAVRLGTEFQESEATSRYFSYALENERGVDGTSARRGSVISGARTRLSDSASIYREDRFEHSSRTNGLSRAMGMSWSPSPRWTFGADWETGTLIDRETQAETDRNAGGGRVNYRNDPLSISTGIEYIGDESEQPDGTHSKRTTWLFRNDLRLQLSPDWRLLAKANHSFSDSSLGEFYDGGYTEAVLGFAYRPVQHDRLDVLSKYTYFYNMPATDQVGTLGTATQFLQRSHIASIDVSYDLTENWTLGGKYAYRRGEVSLDREDPEYFDNDAHLLVARVDWRFAKHWETSVEGRSLILPDLSDRKSGALLTIYRYLGKNFKVGVGYNFTDYSDDLTDLSFDRNGVFFNFIGTL